MDNLAQVIGPMGGRGFAAAIPLIFLLLFTSCGPEKVSAPAPTMIQAQAISDEPSLHPDSHEIRGHPLNDWTYADNLEEFHAVWLARFSLSATPKLDPNTIWPYADSVELNGASWGMAEETTTLIYLDKDGHAYQRSGAAHPTAEGSTATSLGPEALAATGWFIAQTSPNVQRFDERPGFRLAGPVRATESCMGCHAYGPEQVVALMVYDFQEIPDD